MQVFITSIVKHFDQCQQQNMLHKVQYLLGPDHILGFDMFNGDGIGRLLMFYVPENSPVAHICASLGRSFDTYTVSSVGISVAPHCYQTSCATFMMNL